MADYTKAFQKLNDSLNEFRAQLAQRQLTLRATDEWSVKDVLGHIAYWHELYAANYHAMATNSAPCIPQGVTYKVSMKGIVESRKVSAKKLLERLEIAHRSLYESTVIHKVPNMKYHSLGRVYETGYFLEMIARHIHTHTVQIRRAKVGRIPK